MLAGLTISGNRRRPARSLRRLDRLRIGTEHSAAAVDSQDHAVDEPGFGGQEKGHHVGDLSAGAHPAQRVQRGHLGVDVGMLGTVRLVAGGGDGAERHGVRPRAAIRTITVEVIRIGLEYVSQVFGPINERIRDVPPPPDCPAPSLPSAFPVPVRHFVAYSNYLPPGSAYRPVSSGRGDEPMTALRFELLRPPRAWYGDQLLALGPVRQQAVVAVLALNANRAMTARELLSAAWGDEAPATGTKVVAPYIYRVRRSLPCPALLPRTQYGYLLRVEPDQLDISKFDARVAEARTARATEDLAGALAGFTSALDLYDGDPLGGLPGPYLAAHRLRLVELRRQVLGERLDVELQLGRCEGVIAELSGLVQEEPLDERFATKLMIALYLDGRQSLALDVYRRTRTALIDELGVEPGPKLRATHRMILANDCSSQLPWSQVS